MPSESTKIRLPSSDKFKQHIDREHAKALEKSKKKQIRIEEKN